MDQLKETLLRGLNVGTYYAGIVAPIAAVVVIASWFKSSSK